MSTLVAGPWLGEMGWQVATWVPAIRAHVYTRHYEAVTVICRTGHEYLYSDFCQTSYVNDDRRGLPDRWLLNGKLVRPKFGVTCFAELVTPTEKVCMTWPRQFRRYGTPSPGGYDIVFHARAETKYKQAKWNWPVENYRKVAEHFGGLRICCIGTTAHHIPGVEDKRNIPLSELCDLLASAKVMLSPSSGPAHLASHCGCPHVVMTSDKYQKQIKATNRARYEKLWNPFSTPCKVLDHHNWQPPVDKVVKALEKFL